MLEINNLKVVFNQGTVNEKIALNNLSLNLEDGDFVTIIGSNGAGKSSLLNAICGNNEIQSGTIILDGKDITNLKEYKRSKMIGRLFQNPMKGTAPSMSIEENLGLAYSRGTRFALSKGVKNQDRELFKEKLKELDLGLENRLKTPVGLLSGGQRQALTLLMATIVTPKLLLLDEHTAALDPKTTTRIMEITNEIIAKDKITTMMITHDIEAALKYGNKTIVMNSGQIMAIIEGDKRKNMTIQDVMSLYSNYSMQMNDISILR